MEMLSVKMMSQCFLVILLYGLWHVTAESLSTPNAYDRCYLMARVRQENLDDNSTGNIMNTSRMISTGGRSRSRLKSRKRSRAVTFDLMTSSDRHSLTKAKRLRPIFDVMISTDGKSKPRLAESKRPTFDLKSTDLNYICRKDTEFRFASKSNEGSSFQFKSKRLTIKITFLEDLTIKLVAKDAETADGAILTIVFDSFDDIDDFYNEVESKKNAHMKLLDESSGITRLDLLVPDTGKKRKIPFPKEIYNPKVYYERNVIRKKGQTVTFTIKWEENISKNNSVEKTVLVFSNGDFSLSELRGKYFILYVTMRSFTSYNFYFKTKEEAAALLNKFNEGLKKKF